MPKKKVLKTTPVMPVTYLDLNLLRDAGYESLTSRLLQTAFRFLKPHVADCIAQSCADLNLWLVPDSDEVMDIARAELAEAA